MIWTEGAIIYKSTRIHRIRQRRSVAVPKTNFIVLLI